MDYEVGSFLNPLFLNVRFLLGVVIKQADQILEVSGRNRPVLRRENLKYRTGDRTAAA